MSYTVKKLAKLSGVSVRTLHYYDEIDLLKPAFISEAGYRYYTEEQLLVLQQILFFRELGFELKQIKTILSRTDFDKCIALQTHEEILQNKIKRLQELTNTIDNTIKNFEGKQPMNNNMFKGFDVESEQQKKYEEYLEKYSSKFGSKAVENVKKHMTGSKENIKNWQKERWDIIGKEFDEICIKLTELMQRQLLPSSQEVQTIIRKHYNWMSNFWTPNKESYVGHAQFIKDSDLKNAYDKYNPGLSEFIAEAITIFANKLN